MTDYTALDAEPPRRESPRAVTTVEELLTLDETALARGYRAGQAASQPKPAAMPGGVAP
jgi:hypothetical protein